MINIKTVNNERFLDNKRKEVHIGIGFATGRKSFGKVLKNYVYNWQECGLTQIENVHLNLFVAYDLQYKNTKASDYTNSTKDLCHLIDNEFFIGSAAIQNDLEQLIKENVINMKESKLLFGSGYAGKRNALLYAAIKNKMDCLLFLDDDEYPVAVTKLRKDAVWGGQQVLLTHLKNIKEADITNGHHCGYISPIPYIRFNDILTETDFRLFTEAISNDIVNWGTVCSVMNNGGVTYAEKSVVMSEDTQEVQAVRHAKFISGANLCINLKEPQRTFPFYNPPGARGEDTFLSTCLNERKVLRIPVYTFHDGFSTYRHIMDGVLPLRLKKIEADSQQIVTRFYHACIGWVRYKPLLLYITQREHYEERINEMRSKLAASLPKICAYFNCSDFDQVTKELDRYDKNVKKHYRQFIETQNAWAKICEYLEGASGNCTHILASKDSIDIDN